MSDTPKIYIAGMGMISPVGANVAMCAAGVQTGISAYRHSRYYSRAGQPITMGLLPEELFTSMPLDMEDPDYDSKTHERIIKMAILALREAVSVLTIKQPIPLILAMPEPVENVMHLEPQTLIASLVSQPDLPLSEAKAHSIETGRAATIQGLELAQRYLYEGGEDYVLLGGSDSYYGYPRLSPLDEHSRLLTPGSTDGFAPGEGAAFLLLTRHPQLALCRDQHIIALGQPGIAQEPGHMLSDEPYRGEGLDLAFKQALKDYTGIPIHTIYSSMNGESYWAKEYGVAFIRNKKAFQDKVKIEHPADCYGDLGSATAAALIALAAESLFQQKGPATHLAYSSSDSAWRAAVRLEKIEKAANA